MIDLRKKESEDDVYVLIYNGSEDDAKKAASAIGRKPNIHKGNTWYFRYPTEKDARAAWAKSDEKSFEGKFTYKKLAWKDWKNVANESIEKETDMIDLREKKLDEKFDIDKEFDKVMKRFNKEKKELPGKTDMDKIEYILSTSDYNDNEYDSLYDRIENYLENDESCKGEKKEAKISGDDIFDYLEDNGKGKKDDEMADALVKKFGISKETAKKACDAFHKGEVLDDEDLKESCSKKEADDEIKFVNKGEKFKSEKGADVEIIAVDKKDDKTEVTYKLGDEEKKGDIEDVIKMLNGAEYKPGDAKKDEPEKKSDDKEETKKKEETEGDSVEVTLTEDFHVPGTDIVLEKGDVIKIIPRKDD